MSKSYYQEFKVSEEAKKAAKKEVRKKRIFGILIVILLIPAYIIFFNYVFKSCEPEYNKAGTIRVHSYYLYKYN